VPPGDSVSSPEVTRCSSVPCRPQPPWSGGRMRTPSPHIRGLDLSHRWPTGSSLGCPIDYSPVLLRRPFGFPSRRTPCPPKYYKQWLQLRLVCIQLSPSCPFRRLHTFCFLRPARNYPRFWIWRSSFERQRDLNPPEQRAAQRAYTTVLIASSSRAIFRCSPVRSTSSISFATCTISTLLPSQGCGGEPETTSSGWKPLLATIAFPCSGQRPT
jgi:hypothetical protein